MWEGNRIAFTYEGITYKVIFKNINLVLVAINNDIFFIMSKDPQHFANYNDDAYQKEVFSEPATNESFMNISGAHLLVLVGACLACFFLLFFDTSVATPMGRLNNLGLIQDRNNGIYVGGFLILIGVILLVTKRDSPNAAENSSSISSAACVPPSDTKPCPMCAEIIKKAAKVCRFCNHKIE